MRLSVRVISAFFVVSSILTIGGLCRAEVSRKDLEQVEKQVLLQAQKQKQLEKEAEKASRELQRVNQEMIKAAKIIQNNEETISEMEDQLSALEKDCEEAENKLRQQDQNMVKMISALQNLSLKPTEALFVQPLSPVNVVRSALLLRETVPYLEAYAELIKQELDDLRVKQAAVRKQVEKIISQQQQLERQQAQMRALASAKTKYRAQVSKESEATKKEIKKLGSQAQDLKDLLAKLEKDKSEKRKKMAEEAKRKILSLKKSEQDKTVDLIKSDHDIINETGLNFIKAKGTLSYPAMGRVVTRYGEELSKGVSSKGITIQTRNQAQVIAPFDGSVLFAGPFRGYGNLIIIEHGRGYTSLLAGMNDIDCEVGQMLLAGEPVGLMPSSGQARLYMEIRKDNHPINPQSWLKN